MSADADMKKVTVIGSGMVGSVWAALFVNGGFVVALHDVSQAQLDLGLKNALKTLEELECLSMLSAPAHKLHGNIIAEPSLEAALTDCIYVQECVPEKLELKQTVFSNIDTALEVVGNTKCVVASSSSCMGPSMFTGHVRVKDRCLVAHPINPPHFIPLVEVVKAPWTADSAVQATVDILKQIGQTPVVLNKEVNGFLVNRLQYAVLKEAAALVEEGVASPSDVDKAVSEGLGLRWSFMGPFQTIDLNAPGGVTDYFERYGTTINDILRDMGQDGIESTAAIEAINNDVRQEVPLERVTERAAWRNRRLGALAVHKRAQGKVDSNDGTRKQ